MRCVIDCRCQVLRCCSTAAACSCCLGRRAVFVGCDSCDVLCDLMMAKGGATPFSAVAFLDLVLLAGGFWVLMVLLVMMIAASPAADFARI